MTQNSHETPAGEEWRAVPGWSNYEVSDLGRVRRVGGIGVSRKKPYVLKPHPRNGYLSVRLQQEGRQRGRYVHTLVAEAFLGDRPTSRHQVNHKDGDKLNNRLSNLEYCTPAENARHALVTLQRPTHRNGGRRLRRIHVRFIRTLASYGMSASAIARQFGYSVRNVRHIIARETWRGMP